jgi:C1A family cysteine protease
MGSYLGSEIVYPITIRKKYGWIPDIPDRRDKMFKIGNNSSSGSNGNNSSNFPEKFSLRDKMPDIYDQGHLGSCTANAICGAYMYDYLATHTDRNFDPSRLFLYYNERVIENSVEYDAGASIRDGMKVINSIGLCPEKDYPYLINHFRERPSDQAYTDAMKHKCISYESVDIDLDTVKYALLNSGPVVFGFAVPSSFEELSIAQTGFMKNPEINESIIGGHAVVICGYDDTLVGPDGSRGYLLVRNSWGTTWGDSGYFWMPYLFFNVNTCDDAWVLKIIKDMSIRVLLDRLSENTEQKEQKEEENIEERRTEVEKNEEKREEKEKTESEKYLFREIL